MVPRLLLLLFIILSLITLSYSLNIDLSALTSSTDDTIFAIEGVLNLNEGEKLSRDDRVQVTLRSKGFPTDCDFRFDLVDKKTGSTIARTRIPIPSGEAKSTEEIMVWFGSDDVIPYSAPHHTIYATVDFGKNKIPPTVADYLVNTIQVTYISALSSSSTTSDVLQLTAHEPLSVVAHFNTTCTKQQQDCNTSQYTVSVQDIHRDLQQIRFTVLGASKLYKEADVNTTLNCHINNIAIQGSSFLNQSNNLLYYVFVYDFKKGLDYVIRCPNNQLINIYPNNQEWSVAQITGIDTSGIYHTHLHAFQYMYDEYGPILLSSSSPVSEDGADYIFTNFIIYGNTITNPDHGKIPRNARLQFEFTGVKIRALSASVRLANTGTTDTIIIDRQIPNDGNNFYFIEMKDFIQNVDMHITLVAEMASDASIIGTLIQTRMEIQYTRFDPPNNDNNNDENTSLYSHSSLHHQSDDATTTTTTATTTTTTTTTTMLNNDDSIFAYYSTYDNNVNNMDDFNDFNTVTHVVVADIPALISIVTKDYIVKKNPNNDAIVPLNMKLKALPARPNNAMITFRLPAPALQINSPSDSQLECSFGNVQLPPITIKRNIFYTQELFVWKNIDISKNSSGSTFKCKNDMIWRSSLPVNYALHVIWSHDTNNNDDDDDNITIDRRKTEVVASVVVAQVSSHRHTRNYIQSVIFIGIAIIAVGIIGFFVYKCLINKRNVKRNSPLLLEDVHSINGSDNHSLDY